MKNAHHSLPELKVTSSDLISLKSTVQNWNINIISSFVFHKWERNAENAYIEEAGTKKGFS